jgi:hypothetical protein
MFAQAAAAGATVPCHWWMHFRVIELGNWLPLWAHLVFCNAQEQPLSKRDTKGTTAVACRDGKRPVDMKSQ